MEKEFDFDLELDQTMEEIKGKMTGEIWQDIRAILEGEQKFVNEISQEVAKFEKKMQEISASTLKDLLEKATPETEAEFWEALYEYRGLTADINDHLIDVYSEGAEVRDFLQPLITCVLIGYEHKASLLK